MRPGLFVVGVAFVVVGAAALASLFVFPPAPSRSVVDSSLSLGLSPGGSVTSGWIWGENGSSPSFSLRWSSTAPLSVDLLTAKPGAAPCAGSGCLPLPSAVTVVHSWNSTSSGSWGSGSAPTYPYAVRASEPSSSRGPVELSVQAFGAAQIAERFSTAQLTLTAVTAGIVAVIGGIALFLGLFLRGDPYGPAAPIVPLTAEALDAVSAEPPPESPDGRDRSP